MGPDLLIVLIVVAVIVLIWQGPKNLPKLGQGLGRSIKEFRQEVSSTDEQPSTTTTSSTTTPTPPKDEPTP
jgi:TatA/E family protein of Tat protein translocase